MNDLTEKIIEAIRRDVNNIFSKTGSGIPLLPEYQEALVKYYKVLTDAKLAAKEAELEEKVKRAEEALNRGQIEAIRAELDPAGKTSRKL